METNKLKKYLTCEQVYNLWATEPYLLRILDARPLIEFNKTHIPGAVHIDPKNIFNELLNTGDKLAVIIGSENIEVEIKKITERNEKAFDYVFMENCQRWSELNKPIAGESLNSIINDFKKKEGVSMKDDIIFHQLFELESSTYTYIIADKKTKEAAIIDPVLETVDRDLKLIDELGLNLVYVLDTHIHADHITGASEIRKRTQAKTGVSIDAAVLCADMGLEDAAELLLGDKKIKVIATPGHTDTCLSYYFEGMVFTGDALLIRGSGRTDFQQGSSDKLYDSVHEKLFKLPDETLVYPGHDYRGQTSSTILLEKKFNPRLGLAIEKDEFKKIMSELKLANPKKIHEAVPANLGCGVKREKVLLNSKIINGIPEVACEDVYLNQENIRLIDVRRPEEFNNELGHIKGSELIPLGPDIADFLEKSDREQKIVFICRSGARSGAVTAESLRMGYKYTANMTGGMIRWNELQQAVERN